MNTPEQIVAGLKSTEDAPRAAALQDAPTLGASAVLEIAPLLADKETEIRRAGKRALQAIVRHAGRPGAEREAEAVEKQCLAALLGGTDPQARRELLWLLSEIGNEATIKAAAKLLDDAALRDDARCVLERIPAKSAVKALQAHFKSAPEEFKYALAESLRKRGEKVEGYPSKRLVPTKTTNIKPGGA